MFYHFWAYLAASAVITTAATADNVNSLIFELEKFQKQFYKSHSESSQSGRVFCHFWAYSAAPAVIITAAAADYVTSLIFELEKF